MKAPKTSTITALFAALVATGCTVNIQSRPRAEPSPPPAEEDSVDILVSPTHTPRERTEPRRRVEPNEESTRRTTGTTVTRREDPPPPDSVKTEQETVRETVGTTITRREEPPQQQPDTVGSDTKTTDSEKHRRAKQPETVATDDPPDRPGVGKGRDESKEKYPGKGNANGLKKDKKTEAEPDSVTDTPPDRPGVGKGRDESKEKYPGNGNANGLKTQQDKSAENPGQEEAKNRDEKVNAKPEDKGSATGQAKKPDTGTTKQPDAKKETVATKQTNTETKPETKEAASEGENSATAKVAMLEVPSKELPAPGKCRLWIPGQAARDQAKAGKCDEIESGAPAGAWVLYRPNKDKNVVHVKEMDPRRSGVVAKLRVYEAATGKFLWEGSE